MNKKCEAGIVTLKSLIVKCWPRRPVIDVSCLTASVIRQHQPDQQAIYCSKLIWTLKFARVLCKSTNYKVIRPCNSPKEIFQTESYLCKYRAAIMASFEDRITPRWHLSGEWSVRELSFLAASLFVRPRNICLAVLLFCGRQLHILRGYRTGATSA